MLFTSRTLVQDDGAAGLEVGALVTRAICALVRSLRAPPAFLVAKGGITSNDVAVHALGVRRADVLGSVRPGVPVVRVRARARARVRVRVRFWVWVRVRVRVWVWVRVRVRG